ncbi:MAG: nucleotidyltransferase family protein [Candidatus Binatia bacterium]
MPDQLSQDVEASLSQATALLETRFEPAAILLFGSYAGGLVGPLSDIDLAILVGRRPPSAFEIAAARADLEAMLRRPVDLAILDEASPVLAMEVLRRHRVLAKRDAQALENFVVRVLTDYADLKIARRPIEEAVLRVAGGHDQ